MNIHPSIIFVFSSDQQRPLTTLFRCVVVAVTLLLTTGVPQGLHHRTEQRDSSRSVAHPPTCNCNSNNGLWKRSSSSLNSHSNSTACVIFGVSIDSTECAGPSDSTRRDCWCTVQSEYASLFSSFVLVFIVEYKVVDSRFFILDAQYLFLLMVVASGNLRVPCEYSSINCFQTTADFRARILKRNDVVLQKWRSLSLSRACENKQKRMRKASMWRTTLKSPSS